MTAFVKVNDIMFDRIRNFITAALLTATLLPAMAKAAEPMNGAAAYTRGKTLFYGQNGEAYGAEIYMDNQRVKWSFLDGSCKEGYWYESADQICFVYEDNPTPQCWAFTKQNGKLTARFENLPGATQLYEAQDAEEEMICLAPNLGV